MACIFVYHVNNCYRNGIVVAGEVDENRGEIQRDGKGFLHVETRHRASCRRDKDKIMSPIEASLILAKLDDSDTLEFGTYNLIDNDKQQMTLVFKSGKKSIHIVMNMEQYRMFRASIKKFMEREGDE